MHCTSSRILALDAPGIGRTTLAFVSMTQRLKTWLGQARVYRQTIGPWRCSGKMLARFITIVCQEWGCGYVGQAAPSIDR